MFSQMQRVQQTPSPVRFQIRSGRNCVCVAAAAASALPVLPAAPPQPLADSQLPEGEYSSCLGILAVPPAITGSSTPNPLHSSAAHGLISLKAECLFPLLATISTEKCTPFPIQLKHCASPFETFYVDCHWQECEDYAAF